MRRQAHASLFNIVPVHRRLSLCVWVLGVVEWKQTGRSLDVGRLLYCEQL